MKSIDFENYTREAVKTWPLRHNGTKIDMSMLMHSVYQVLNTITILDQVKKNLFLDTPIDYRKASLAYAALAKILMPLGSVKPSIEYSPVALQLVHAIIGIVTEAGELLQILAKSIVKGQDFTDDESQQSVVEETGDLMFYIAMLCDMLDINLGDVLDKNIKKLRVRYGKKFSAKKANNRNLKAEKAALK